MAFDFLTYMKEIAEKHVKIQHSESDKNYYRVSGIGGMEDLLLNLSEANGVIMVVETNKEGRIQGVQESYIDIPRFRFFILKQRDFGDIDSDTAAKQECKDIAFSILARMRHDKIQAQRGEADRSYNDIMLSSIRYDTVGPIVNGFVGMMVEFMAESVASENGFTYNSDDYS
jgi:hypothetical protein